jgi:acyl-coenzyme A thioesterase PaaI-like protein
MPTEPVMSRDAVAAYLDEVFPQIHHGGPGPVVDVERHVGEHHHRGPRQGAARPHVPVVIGQPQDRTQLGPVPLAVTTSLSFNFLRKPARRDLLGEARIMKS